jgi:CRISPR-associated endonuclease Cas3-HD
MKYYAHSTRNPDRSDWETVETHLRETARTARANAQKFGAGEFGYWAGLFHDIGKFQPSFQRRVVSKDVAIDHSSPGAREIAALFPNGLFSQILAYCIAGHHSGLPDWGTNADPLNGDTPNADTPNADTPNADPPNGDTPNGGTPNAGTPNGGAPEADTLKARLQRPSEDYSAYRECADFTIKEEPRFPFPPAEKALYAQQLALFTRMVYSALTDADYIQTERFITAAHGGTAAESMRADFSAIAARRGISPNIGAKGFYSCGGGVEAAFDFALGVLSGNGLDRIIYVAPNADNVGRIADILRAAAGGGAVLEQRCDFEFRQLDEENVLGKRTHNAIEDWNAPIVVTADTQFFGMLFGNRKSALRKLHNIVKTVLVFDTEQALPAGYLQPCRDMLTLLVKDYGITVLSARLQESGGSDPQDGGIGAQDGGLAFCGFSAPKTIFRPRPDNKPTAANGAIANRFTLAPLADGRKSATADCGIDDSSTRDSLDGGKANAADGGGIDDSSTQESLDGGKENAADGGIDDRFTPELLSDCFTLAPLAGGKTELRFDFRRCAEAFRLTDRLYELVIPTDDEARALAERARSGMDITTRRRLERYAIRLTAPELHSLTKKGAAEPITTAFHLLKNPDKHSSTV